MGVSLHNTTRRTLPEARIRRAVLAVLAGEGCEVESVGAIFCGNRMIRRINRDFLAHDYATDTITFTYSEEGPVEGEFYVSLDVIASNARRFGATFEHELLRVVIHSALHLAGWPDESAAERLRMQEKEEEYLALVMPHPKTPKP